jgi:signal peptidase I
MKKILFALPIVTLLAVGCNMASQPSAPTSISNQAPSKQEVIEISTNSMAPTLTNREIISIDTSAKTFSRGDIIVFKYPNDTTQTLVKRIIGLPGETVTIKTGHVFINGQQLDETTYLPVAMQDQTFGSSTPVSLQANKYFVLGDNRTASSDSRVWGILDGDLIVGKYVKVISGAK